MKKKLVLLLVVIMMTLCGCWSKRELNELAICVGLGIDKAKDGYLVSVQIVNPGELSGKQRSGRSEVLTAKVKGDTVFEALRRLSTFSPRKIYMAQLRQVVFSEELAKEGIGKTLDFLARDHELRTDFYITVAKGQKALDILKVQSALENIPVNKLYASMKNSERSWTVTKTVQLDELINNILSPSKEAVLTGIHLTGNPDKGGNVSNVQHSTPATTLHIGEIGAFKSDRLIGWLTEDESKGYNYITDNVYNTLVTVPCHPGKISIETIRSKTDVKGKVKNGKPQIDLTVTSEGNIGEVMCNVDLLNPDHIKQIESDYKLEIEDKLKKVIYRAQNELHSDIFGFGEVIHRDDPVSWKKLKANWNQEFKNVEVTIHVNAEIRRLGTISESLQNQNKGE
ncbi:Ger(x)C family spore germination protein [Bacillus tuaregi]|uniref:Ger(x)C family spore germination protein n=1 Tax=Bacillus tuaregi TaxID=1816695 RepID=UPI0008F9632C|nr:Ger(x)C family spore germination protein [Bacillus tuaregi]